jgi:hypothetical protein
MHTIELTDEEYAIVCGLVQPDWMNVEPPHDKDAVNHAGIFSEAWDSLREKFPLENFRDAVSDGVIDYNQEAGL